MQADAHLCHVQPGQSTDIGSEDTALAAFVRGGSDTDGALLVGGPKSQVNANLWQVSCSSFLPSAKKRAGGSKCLSTILSAA